MNADELMIGLIVMWVVFGVLYLLFMQKASDERFRNHPMVKKGEDEIKELHKKWGQGDE